MQKLVFQTESMSQCQLKIQICMQKLLKIGRLFFLIISVCPNFLQLSIILYWFKSTVKFLNDKFSITKRITFGSKNLIHATLQLDTMVRDAIRTDYNDLSVTDLKKQISQARRVRESRLIASYNSKQNKL